MKNGWTLILLTAALTGSLQAATENFDALKTGPLPTGWTGTNTGQGSSKWEVVADETAPSKPNVLRQSNNASYPLVLKEGSSLKDGFVQVRFKLVSGEEDQAAGVVFRATDANNYYIARANGLEGNVRIYHFLNGKRTQFKGSNLAVASNTWHTLRVNFSGARFTVLLNGQELFSAEDTTLTAAGKVGLWTKADSVSLFDDLTFGEK